MGSRFTRSRAAAIGIAAGVLAIGPARPEVVLPGSDAPVPTSRPYPNLGKGVDIAATTSSIVLGYAADMPAAAAQGELDKLEAGLDAVSANDMSSARADRDALPRGSLDRQILAWSIALSGSDQLSSAELTQAARELAGWPGLDAIRRNAERALAAENPPPAAVVQAFGASAPQTVDGTILLARADVALGRTEAARAILVPFWRSERLQAQDEEAVIREFGALIPAADHRYRMERMLYVDRVSSAERVAALADADALEKAWGAVIRDQNDAGKLLDAVPRSQRGAGYLFAMTQYLRHAEKFKQAEHVMLQAPREAASLIDPDAWWVERRVLSRELLDIGDVKGAYRLVAAHSDAASATAQADAEFHAGWYALRGLNDPRTAASHFAEIAKLADGPITLSRAYYWLGRAAEAGGPGNAKAYYAEAAQYGTTFYGQLAAARLGRDVIAAPYPEPTEVDRTRFVTRPAVRAIKRLQAAGHEDDAGMLYRDLASELTSPGELALLAVMAESQNDHYTALRVGKIAAGRGIDIGALSHPIGVIPSSADISGAGKALAYAVARQESEFNVGAVSGAGARGLLQLLPGTARAVAKRNGLEYSKARLTTDAGYNATLGAAFLKEQLDRFGGSYILTFIAYNAGPRRASEWMDRYGDPRGKDIDAVVDWIERIPYTETRSYVERVMENYQVYKMRLSGHFDIVGDLTAGG